MIILSVDPFPTGIQECNYQGGGKEIDIGGADLYLDDPAPCRDCGYPTTRMSESYEVPLHLTCERIVDARVAQMHAHLHNKEKEGA